MKRIKLLVLFVLFSVCPGFSQISISISSSHNRYINFEPVQVKITLRNYSGHSLNFGNNKNEGGYLKFHIKNSNGNEIRAIEKDFNPVSNLVISAGIVKTITLSLTDYYPIQGHEDFEIKARVGHRRLARDQLSNPIHLQIRNGRQIWSRTAGIPTAQDESIIQTRTCSLNVFSMQHGDIFYLKIENQDYVQSIVRLGPRIIGIQPECDIDALSRIHTLVQTAPRLFKHRIFDLNGKLMRETTYIYESSQPKLLRDSEFGTIQVNGGKIAQEGIDYNIKKPSASTEEMQKKDVEGKKTKSDEDGFFKRTFKRFFKD